MTLKLDVNLSTSLLDAATRARELQKTGVDGVFSFENAHDVFFPLVVAAPECSLDLMTNVAIAFPRSPLHLAHAAYDLHAYSEGRFRLGLGSQVRAHIENRYGGRWDRPVAQMREWTTAIKEILTSWQDGTRLSFEGTYSRHTLMTPAFNPGPNPFGMPKVLVGALGPRMNQMAAEVADGILLMPFNSARHMAERTMPAIEAGLAAAGRHRTDIEITAEVIVAVGRTEEELERARAARFVVGFYASTPSYRPVLEVEGWEELQPELNLLSKQGDWAGMGELVDDDVFGTIAVVGSPKEVATEIVTRFGHCDRICAFFPGYEVSDDLIADFADALREEST